MREHMRSIIDQARRSEERISANNQPDLPRRLASQTIRWARIAASSHMVLSARMNIQADARSPRVVEKSQEPTP
ncbi:MAG: hypothetical protein V3T53_11545 [Phycisphaerales bacterium]